MEKENKMNSREKDETKEKEEFVDSKVPENRFQGKQQVQKPVESGMDAKVQETPFTAKKQKSEGSQLKQEAVSKVITGSGGSMPEEGIASPSRAGLRTLAYSGNEGTILGSPSGTPVVGSPSRSDTRPGQKLDAVAKAIDFIASEQVYQEVRGSVPLQENPTEVQGFLGHPENNNARLQKVVEAVPGALMYARSCDEISRDEIAFVEGQMIPETGITYAVSPTKTYIPELADDGDYYKPYTNPRGNYIPKTMHVGVSTSGEILSMSFDVDDINRTRPSKIVNRSSSAYVRAMNIDEINRQNMEAKAGIETEKNWCPMVRAVAQPTQTVGYCTDDEITTGSELYMAYRFGNKAHSYFFNKAAKDGQTPYRSFKEMLKGLALHTYSSSTIDDSVAPFTGADYQNGAPSLAIALYDSITKYSKRGDLLTQPRSWKMLLQTADNNINPFRMHPQLAQYVSNRDVFSTIDRAYDPLLPVHISDNWRLSHVLNFNNLMRFASAKSFTVKLGGKGVTTAGTAFNNVYDAINTNTSTHTVGADLQKFASGSASGHNIYNDLGYASDSRSFDSAPVIKTVGDKDGFDSYDDGLNAAYELLATLPHQGNNIQLHPIIILFKVANTAPNPDDVYAYVRYPNLIAVTATPNLKLFISYDTTSDYMASDTSVDTVLLEKTVLENDVFVYKYKNRQNPYIVEVKNPLLYGIKEWFKNFGQKLKSPNHTSGDSNGVSHDDQNIIWYHIPIIHSTTNMSMWDLIVCASVPFMQKVRTNSQFDTLNYEEMNGSYPYSQLMTLKDLNPLASANFALTDRLKPITVGQMKPATAISWIMPEKFWRIDHEVSTGAVTTETFVLPFYFCHEGYACKPDSTSIVSMGVDEDGHVMNFPSVRAGARSAFVDHFFDMSERDIRLCLDMMTDIPTSDDTHLPTSEGVYRYGVSNSGIPVVKYQSSGQLNIRAYLTAPRELGLGMVAPAGYNSVAISRHVANNVATYKDYATLSALISYGTSYQVRTWKVEGGQYRALHASMNLVVKRGGNFSQEWTRRGDLIYAPTDNTSVESYGTLDAARNVGIALNFNDAMEVTSGAIAGEAGSSVFKPFTYKTATTNQNLPSIITLQNVLWPRLQVLPFALSPFDQTPEGRDDKGTAVTCDMTADPYDFMYMFGFAGFKASDYREDVYNRISERETLGWTFVEDPFVKATPVLK